MSSRRMTWCLGGVLLVGLLLASGCSSPQPTDFLHLGLPFCPGLYGLAASSQTKDGQRMCPPPGPKNPMGYKHLSATRPARCISILMRLSEPASQNGKRRPDSTRQEINQLRLHFDFVEVTRSLHLLLARYTEDSIGQRH